MPRLPLPGQDDGAWGNILNDFLAVAHNTDGSLRSSDPVIDSKVDTSRKILTIGGLTGGGDLTADRTLSLDGTYVAEMIRDTMSTALVAGSGVTVTPDNTANTITIGSTATNDVYNVKKYGAMGDGTTDDTIAIESAAAAAGAAKGTLWFPEGTFLVTKLTGKDHCIEARAGLTIDGPGTIKVKNGTGNYSSVIKGASWATDLSGLSIRNITIDQNNTGNPLTDISSLSAESGFRMAIMVGSGVGMSVRGVKIKDIDAINTISFNGTAVKNIRIQDCDITGVGSSPSWHDHSTLYTDCEGAVITGNVFRGTPGGKGCVTAIETHGSAQVVMNNRVEDYYTGMNITGVSSTHGNDGIVVVGNTLNDINIGIQLWSQTFGTGMKQCVVADNTVVINHDEWASVLGQAIPSGILLAPTIDKDIEGLTIHHNNIWFKPWAAAAQSQELSGAGIAMWAVTDTPKLKDVRISDNTIKGAMSAGIRWSCHGERVRIENNEIIDPGMSTGSSPEMFDAYRVGIIVSSSQTDLVVRNNRTFDTRATHKVTASVASYFSGYTLTRSYQGANTIVCYDAATVPAYVVGGGSALLSFPLDDEVAGAITSGAATQAAGDARWLNKDAPSTIQSTDAINNDFGTALFSVLRSSSESHDPNQPTLQVNGAGQVRAGWSDADSFGSFLAENSSGIMAYGATNIEALTGSSIGLLAKTSTDQVKIFRGMLGLSTYATASRPPAGNSYGCVIFDTDLAVPLYCNGSAWFKFDGTVA